MNFIRKESESGKIIGFSDKQTPSIVYNFLKI